MTEQTEAIEKGLIDKRRKDLRDFRERVGMDLRELSRRTQISFPMLNQFETGYRNLSEKKWKRVEREILKFYHRPPASVRANPIEAEKVREIVVRFQPDVGYPSLIRRFDEKEWQESRDNLALAESLSKHLKADYGHVAKWLDAEIALEVAKQRAMKAAELVRSGYEPDEMLGVIKEADETVTLVTMAAKAKPYEFREAAALMACEQDKTGKTIPWQRKLSKPKPNTSFPEFDIRIAHNQAEEEALVKAGWQLVKSE